MTNRKINGYAMNYEITRAMNANKIARAAIKSIINDEPSILMRNTLLAKAATALAENLEALQTIREIKQNAPAEWREPDNRSLDK